MGKPNTIIKEVSGIRQHRNYIWLIAAVLVGLLGGAAMLLAVSRSDNATLDEIAAARAALKSTALVPKETPDVTGFSLNILTDAVGASFFDTDETAAAEVDARIRARDAHLTEETGAAVQTTVAADFVQAAQADILSGAYRSNLYVADAAGSLSKLHSTASLRDMTDAPYLRTDENWFGGRLMDSLRVGGKRYLLSSSAADARLGTVAVVYNRRLLTSLDGTPDEGADLAAVALDGGRDGLDFYRVLVRQYRDAVRPGGWLVLEIGYAQAEAVLALGKAAGWQGGTCRKDAGGNDRVVFFRKPLENPV